MAGQPLAPRGVHGEQCDAASGQGHNAVHQVRRHDSLAARVALRLAGAAESKTPGQGLIGKALLGAPRLKRNTDLTNLGGFKGVFQDHDSRI